MSPQKKRNRRAALVMLVVVTLTMNAALLVYNPWGMGRLQAPTLTELGVRSTNERMVLYGGLQAHYTDPTITISDALMFDFNLSELDLRMLGGAVAVNVADTPPPDVDPDAATHIYTLDTGTQVLFFAAPDNDVIVFEGNNQWIVAGRGAS